MNLEAGKPPDCEHCGATMVKFDLPPVAFSDGLGWGSTFLWVCPSDECPVFRKGFEHNLENYGQTSSLRSIIEPDTGRASVTPAFSMDPQHFSSFIEIRKKSMEELKNNPDDLPAGDDDDEWPSEEFYDPSK